MNTPLTAPVALENRSEWQRAAGRCTRPDQRVRVGWLASASDAPPGRRGPSRMRAIDALRLDEPQRP